MDKTYNSINNYIIEHIFLIATPGAEVYSFIYVKHQINRRTPTK